MKIKLLGLIGFLSMASVASAHCQVPCGIYDDAARVSAMIEDAATVSKAVKSIEGLEGKESTQELNQKVRWVNNKESHADKIIQTISNYFLTQRVKSSQEDYVERLKKHHAVIVAAMKAKQTVSSENAKALVSAIEALATYYPEAK